MKAVVALAGGVGAARFLDGLSREIGPERIFIIGNVGDDAVIQGLHISPDLDTVMYTLAGIADPRRGWGVRGDTFHFLEALRGLGEEAWFQLGDRDLSTHVFRTVRLAAGEPLSRVTAHLASALAVRARIVPATDSALRTFLRTPRGRLDFQTYFVKRRAADRVLGVEYRGARRARPAPGVLKAIRNAAAIIICPSNPYISIGPILAVPGVRDALRRARARIAAISPIVAGRALKGPAARMMKSMGVKPSALEVARMYRDFVDVFVLDRADSAAAGEVEALGMEALAADTIMTGTRQRRALARAALRAAGL